jgi:hypothetical protein
LAIGPDCIGGLQFLPDSAARGARRSAIEARAVDDEAIVAIVANLASAPTRNCASRLRARRKNRAPLLEAQVARHDRGHANHQAADQDTPQRH